MKWPDTSRNEDFGLPEPGALGFSNILFPFTSLLTGIITASTTTVNQFVTTINNDEETNLLFPTNINESIYRASESLVAQKK